MKKLVLLSAFLLSITSILFAQGEEERKKNFNIKKNIAVHIPAHYIPAFKPAKEFVAEVKKLVEVKPDAGPGEDA